MGIIFVGDRSSSLAKNTVISRWPWWRRERLELINELFTNWTLTCCSCARREASSSLPIYESSSRWKMIYNHLASSSLREDGRNCFSKSPLAIYHFIGREGKEVGEDY